jgi:hypothetical protein
LLRALRAKVHRHLGYGSFFEYVERLFGYTRRTTRDKLRTAQALEHLPALDLALREGRVHGSAARELARVASAETEAEWLLAAQDRTLREIEDLVSGRAPGDRPRDPARPNLRRHVLRFEVRAETLATFREAMKTLIQLAGEGLDDDAALLLMARSVLGGSVLGGSGRANIGCASYQIAITQCERCGDAFQRAGGEDLRVEPAIFDMADCDAQYVGHVGAPVQMGSEALPLEAAPANAAPARARACAVPVSAAPARARACAVPVSAAPASARAPLATGSTLAAPASAPDIDGNGAPRVELMPTASVEHGQLVSVADGPRSTEPPLESTSSAVEPSEPVRDEPVPPRGPTHVGRRLRATQSVPPALRRLVLARDRGRCVVPGCQHHVFVDLHHIQPRAKGGRHDPNNIVTLCSAHHRAIHSGALVLSGSVRSGLCFQRADGSPYASHTGPQSMDLSARVFRALRGLGFKKREARQALAAVRSQPLLPQATAEQLLRSALGLLTRPAAPRPPEPARRAGPAHEVG